MKNCNICYIKFKAIGNAKTCSTECSIILSNNYKNLLKKVNFKECVVCKNQFKVIHNRAKTCSKLCSKRSISIRVNNRYNNDINFKLSDILRSRLNKALKNNQKSGSAIEDLGCSVDELIVYIENQFQDGMTWDNHSLKGWHIDHIDALANFDLTIPEELKKACHYTNLQPLWADENQSKGNK